MARLELGTTVPPREGPILLDLDTLVESRLLLQANSGAGKSWALRRLLEQSHGHVQHLVLDIEGEFHTLREKYDYVLAAHTGGDTLADVRTAALLARRLLELGVSAILDLYELRAPERVRFVRLFLESLIEAPRSLWHPVLVVVDEAHHFAPQIGEAESAAAVIDLMTRGRKRGYCGILATQRLSKLHKDAAAEANVKLIGRATLDVDMKRAAEELGLTAKEDRSRLRTLPRGSFFAFGPGLSDQIVEVEIGGVQTTHPKPGQRAAPVPPPPERVRRILAKLADLPREAEQEAKTAAELRAQVAKLTQQLAAAPAQAMQEIEVPVVRPEEIEELRALAGHLQSQSDHLRETARLLTAHSDGLRESAAGIVAELSRVGGGEARKTTVAAPRPAPPTAAVPPAKSPGMVAGHVYGRKAERRILQVLAQYPEGRTKRQLALLTGYAITGGGFNNALSLLRSNGLIEGSRLSLHRITAKGSAEICGVWEPLPTGVALLQHWYNELDRAGRLILQALAAAYPVALTKAEVAARTGYEVTGGGFNNALSRLRTLELIAGKSELMAAAELFD